MILTADGIYDLILPAQVDTGSSTRGLLFSGDLGGATATIGYTNDFGDFVPFRSDSAELGKNFKSGHRLDLEHGAGVLPKLKIVGSTARTEIYVKVAAVREGGSGGAGADGADGKSAYQTWLDNGNSGTEADFLASIDGADGVALRTGTAIDVGNSSDTKTNLYGDVTATGDISSNNGEHILSNKANGGFLTKYVRAWSNGNTSNTSNHYIEIQAIGLDGSIASGVAYKMGVDGVKQTSDARLTDGDTTVASNVTVDSGRAGILLELDTETVISEVKLWRYYVNSRTYFETAIEISEDGVNWYAIHDYNVVGTYAESSSGYTAKATIDKIVQLGLTNSIDGLTDGQNDATNLNLFLGGAGFTGTFYNTLNTGVGLGALATPNTDNSTSDYGNYNVALGANSLTSNTTGYYNVAVGADSLYYNSIGKYNLALGANSIYSNTTGSYNSSIGANSLYHNTTGTANVAIGVNSLYTNTTGNYNIAFGLSSLNSNTTGSNNASIGTNCLYSNTTGIGNTGLGHNAGKDIAVGGNNTNSSNSIFIGIDTKPDDDNQTNQIVIGSNATGYGSNTTVIGDDNIIKTVLKGLVDIVSGGLNVFGYTKLGSDAPAIKQKKLAGITASSQGGTVSIPHGLNGDKILSCDVRVQYTTGAGMFPNHSVNGGYRFEIWNSGTQVVVRNDNTSSTNILSKPFTVLITYEE